MNDKFSVVYSSVAKDDLQSIYSYIAFNLRVPNAARKQVNRIRHEIRSLNFMPMRYSVVDWEPWKSMNIHKLPVDNFVIYYMVNENTFTVTVIRIVYCGMDIESIIESK